MLFREHVGPMVGALAAIPWPWRKRSTISSDAYMYLREERVGGHYAALFFKLMLAVAAVACVSMPAVAADRVALVIGNGKYVNANTLPNPPNDARAMAKALSNIDFDVSFGEDLDHTGMERLVRDFLRKSASAKIALIFYAGHGLQVDGRNYLVPIDAKLEAASDLNYETVKLDDILDSLNDDPSRANIIILDACRDNPLARTFAAHLGASRSAAVSTGLAPYSTVGSGTLIAFSTAPGQVALDGDGANSPFTEGLLKYLATPGLEVRQMLTRVRDDVARATHDRQLPWDNSSLRGDVYLANAPDTAAVAPNAAAVPPSATAVPPNAAAVPPKAAAVPPNASEVPRSATPAPDEVAWDFVKDTHDADQVRHFITEFPRSAHLVEAAEKLAALQPHPAEAATDIAKKLQIELHRVGCLTAEPDGDWNAGSIHALDLFNRYSGSSLDSKVASLDALESVRSKAARICPLICDSGYHADGDQCVPSIRRRLQERHYRAGGDSLSPFSFPRIHVIPH
jgi:hypothetical protein